MRKFKRFCMIAYGIAAALGVSVLAVLWFAWEPLLPAIAWLMGTPWFFAVESVLIAITAAGIIVLLASAIAAPDKRSKLQMDREGGSIAITQNAVRSTVKHVVEAHHGLSVSSTKVDVTNRRSPRMAVHVKIDPGRNSNLSRLGKTLQEEIAATLHAFTGYPVDSVQITFAGDADAVTPSFTQRATTASASARPAASIPSVTAPMRPSAAHATAK